MLDRIIKKQEYIILAKNIIHYRKVGDLQEKFGFENFWKIIQIYDHKKIFDLFLSYLVRDHLLEVFIHTTTANIVFQKFPHINNLTLKQFNYVLNYHSNRELLSNEDQKIQASLDQQLLKLKITHPLRNYLNVFNSQNLIYKIFNSEKKNFPNLSSQNAQLIFNWFRLGGTKSEFERIFKTNYQESEVKEFSK